jgi:hypothetical protein
MSAISEAALRYALMGWPIVPLKGKRPIPKDWPSKASTQEGTILNWLREFPEANIGIATGARAGFFVLDVDGEAGEESLVKLQEQHGTLPTTLEGITGGGGRHILFQFPAGVELGNSNKALKAKKLDIRGNGGQIVAPPSIHPTTGVVYEWVSDPATTAIAAAPAWLIELLTKPEEYTVSPQAVTEIAYIEDERARKYGISALQGEEKNVRSASEGTLNNTLNNAALKIGSVAAACGISEAMAEAVLVGAAVAAGHPRTGALATFRSGWKAGLAKPRHMPESDRPRPSIVPSPTQWEDDLVGDYESQIEQQNQEGGEHLGDDVDAESNDDGDEPPREIPSIQIRGGELDLIVDQAEQALMAAGIPVYQRGGALVRPIRQANVTIRGVSRQGSALLLADVEEAWLIEAFTRAAMFMKFDGRTMQYKRIDCPPAIAKTYLARSGDWKVPVLVGVIESPTLRPDGSILETPGFDEETGLLLDTGRARFSPVPENPSREMALAALDKIKALLVGFPFDADHDEAIAVAAILTGLVRRSIPTAPMFAFNAPKMGSGKSLLADLVSLFATGRRASVMTPAANPDEEAKRLLAILMEGDPVISIDNISAPLFSDAMCTILTQEVFKGRVLGASKTVTAPTCVTWLATGNNLVFLGDMTTRLLRCDLDPQMERPEERAFKVNLHEAIPERRADLVPAALTILRAFVVAGRPAQDVPQFGRFEAWSDWVRGALVWLGMPDPCLSRHDLEESDSIRTSLVSVLAAWHEVFGDERVTAQKAIAAAKHSENEMLMAALMEVAGAGNDVNSKRLGKWLKRFEKRIEGGFRLEKAGVSHSTALWRVISTEGGLGALGGVRPATHVNSISHVLIEQLPLYPPNPPSEVEPELEVEEGDA